MATITGLTAARMIEIEDASVVSGTIVGDDLILTTHGGDTVNAGNVRGPQGIQGLGPGMIPGEVRLWSGDTLPDIDEYSRWVWADGDIYPIADHPIAAANISDAWNTFDGHSSPGAGNFRVPDYRGLVPAGMDAMPGGSRINRMTRSVAITLAGKTGEETHIVTILEMPTHDHNLIDPGHTHDFNDIVDGPANIAGGVDFTGVQDPTSSETTGITIDSEGGDDPHENVQPTVFVPYIVCLDG